MGTAGPTVGGANTSLTRRGSIGGGTLCDVGVTNTSDAQVSLSWYYFCAVLVCNVLHISSAVGISQNVTMTHTIFQKKFKCDLSQLKYLEELGRLLLLICG